MLPAFSPLSRRKFCQLAAGSTAALCLPQGKAQDEPHFQLRYIVASCLYGTAPLREIIPEVPRSGAQFLELWAEPHGNQREQVDELGIDQVRALLEEHHVRIGSITCFKQGIFEMQPEMAVTKALGGDMVICNSRGPKNLAGDNLRAAVTDFAEQLRPHVAAAEKLGVAIGVENHSGGLISSRDSILWLLEAIPSAALGLALAPSHLPQESNHIAELIRDVGPRLIHFQAWQKGDGFLDPLPKEQELKQLPHRGPLDWKPILKALKDIDYRGRTEVFMHPFPRGAPILSTTAEITAELNFAREFLNTIVAGV